MIFQILNNYSKILTSNVNNIKTIKVQNSCNAMQGILPSLNTPFHTDGSLDFCSVRRLVNHTIKSGCTGMLALAVAGEHETLSFVEKKNLIRFLSDENSGRIPLIVNITSNDLTTSLNLTHFANSCGVDGVCIHLSKEQSMEQNLKILKEISKCSPEIIMLQDLDWSNEGLDISSISKLFKEVPKFSWLKIETKNAGQKYTQIKAMNRNKLKVCGGWTVTHLMDALDREVDAFIPTGLEYIYNKIYKEYKNGKIRSARALFHKLFKEARVREGLFESSYCRVQNAIFDPTQRKEATVYLDMIDRLLHSI